MRGIVKHIFNWLVFALAIFVAAYLLPGVRVEGFVTALLVAVVLGLINTFLRPILFFITFPLSILTFGLFIFILNALLVMLASGWVDGFKVDGILWALAFSVLVSLINFVLKKK